MRKTAAEVVQFPDSSPVPTGFDKPLEVLRLAHERVRRMVEMLVLLREHLLDHGADSPGLVTARTIREYFEQDWPRHLQDEEADVLPRLQARLRDRATAGAATLRETIDSVLEQHRAFEPLLARILALLHDIESGTAQRLHEPAVTAFVHLYRIHIALEEDVLGPAFAKLLTAQDLRDIGRAMARRRETGLPRAGAPA
jgi:hemerythrin-like domain-containing protein